MECTDRVLIPLHELVCAGMDSLRTGLSYGDALLIPQRSSVASRSDVDLSTMLVPGIELDNPLLSAPMDTVTEWETAAALSEAGGFGTIHRFLTTEEQATEVRSVIDAGERCGAAVGIDEDYISRTDALLEAGAACIVVDVAHGHMERALEAVADLNREFDAPIVAGNVATPAGVRDLYAAGADSVKVGIGPGSHCTTRRVAGAGVPQLTAVNDCADVAEDLGIAVIADGGIRSSGDAVKALMAGASTVMMGSLFAGTTEAPGTVVKIDGTPYKRSRGMASTVAAEERSDKDDAVEADEGVEGLTPFKGPLADVVEEFTAGIRSGLSYCGGHTIPEARTKAEFVRVAPDAQLRSGPHGDHDWEGVSVDHVEQAAGEGDD